MPSIIEEDITFIYSPQIARPTKRSKIFMTHNFCPPLSTLLPLLPQ